MNLKEVLAGIEYEIVQGSFDLDITGISYDSRRVKPGDLFICISGFKNDGHDYVQEAFAKGARALAVEKDIIVDAGVSLIKILDGRKAMPAIAANFYEHPSREVKVIGVTGTNGKTTTTHLIKAILEEHGARVGIMGTLYARLGEQERNLGHTTPESVDIEDFIDLVRRERGEYLIMEVSSHALALGRVDQILFHAAIFTNLTQDHLDYHLTMENYRDAKLKLFLQLQPGEGRLAVINADDPAAGAFIKASSGNSCTYGIDQAANVMARDIKITIKNSRFKVVGDNIDLDINMKLIGRFSIYNALAAIAFCWREGIPPEIIKRALESTAGVPGRLEAVDCGQDFTVIVDYAHTPDGLENILKTAQEVRENRLITVFGCGGDRDRTKRPLMGKIAAQYSDFCIVTSDNPRSEDPESIIDEIMPGLNAVENSHYAKIIDRREAIHQAICLAKTGDLVVIAGKGHETYQLVKDQVLHFDDREVAAEFLRSRLES